MELIHVRHVLTLVDIPYNYYLWDIGFRVTNPSHQEMSPTKLGLCIICWQNAAWGKCQFIKAHVCVSVLLGT
jgi:hypothetical protein